MFVISEEHVKNLSTEELEKTLAIYNAYLDRFDWSKYKQGTFGSDKASGWTAGKEKIEAELEMRKTGVEVPLPDVTVPGYNPGKNTK
jgi:hypothetical protein